MEITINKTVTQTIQVPKYFKKNGTFCKVLNETHFIRVSRPEVDFEMDFVPSIVVYPSRHYLNDSDFTEITQTEFDLAFLQAEKILNELRKS